MGKYGTPFIRVGVDWANNGPSPSGVFTHVFHHDVRNDESPNNPGRVVQGRRFSKADDMKQKAVTEALSRGATVGVLHPDGTREIIKPVNQREVFDKE